MSSWREEATTLVGNALTALDDPDGIPDMDAETPIGERVGYATGNLGAALKLLEPGTYGEASLKLTIEIELGNDAMQTGADVADALGRLAEYIDAFATVDLRPGVTGGVRDLNGNTVGSWEVVA